LVLILDMLLPLSFSVSSLFSLLSSLHSFFPLLLSLLLRTGGARRDKPLLLLSSSFWLPHPPFWCARRIILFMTRSLKIQREQGGLIQA
jgi:hypothetical protein